MYCQTCWSEFNSEATARMHYESNAHLDSVKFHLELKEKRLLSPFYCETCSLYANSRDSLVVHLGSKTHRLKTFSKEKILKYQSNSEPLQQLSKAPSHSPSPLSENTKPSTNSNSSPKSLNNYCEICSTQFDSAIAFAVHMGSGGHKSRLKHVQYSSKQRSPKNYPMPFFNYSDDENLNKNEKMPLPKSQTYADGFNGHSAKAKEKWDDGKGDLSVRKFFCEICLVVLNSEDSLNTHFKSEKHKKKAEIRELINRLNTKSDASSSCSSSNSSSESAEKGFARLENHRRDDHNVGNKSVSKKIEVSGNGNANSKYLDNTCHNQNDYNGLPFVAFKTGNFFSNCLSYFTENDSAQS